MRLKGWFGDGSAAVIAACLAFGCNEDYRRTLEDGFDSGIGVEGDAERNFRGAMANYHMAEVDIDCMVGEAFENAAGEIADGPYWWSAEELNAFATKCGVDFADLWYMVD